MVSFAASAALADGIPDARLITLPPGPHAAFDIVDRLAPMVLDFCERPSPGSAEILCTRTLHDLAAGSGLLFECPGTQQLKGLPEAVDVYRVTAG